MIDNARPRRCGPSEVAAFGEYTQAPSDATSLPTRSAASDPDDAEIRLPAANTASPAVHAVRCDRPPASVASSGAPNTYVSG
jgi:hypothetical protein